MKKYLALPIIFLSSVSLAGLPTAMSSSGAGGVKTAGNVGISGATQAGVAAGDTATQSGMCSAAQMIHCIFAGLAAAQMGMSLLSAKSGRNAAKALTGGNGSADWDTTDLGNGLNGGQLDNKIDLLDSQYKKLTSDLVKKGVDVDKNTVKTPKGDKPLSSLGSGAALADAGIISVDQIGAVDEALKKQQAKYQNISMNNSIGGGGGSASRTTASYEFQSPDYSSMFGDKEKPNAPKTAGLVKTINGQSYGASVNNIFDMIRNRYDIKTKEKFFVEQ